MEQRQLVGLKTSMVIKLPMALFHGLQLNRSSADMRRYCDALQHDLRFGGNIKSKDFADLFATKYSRQNIQFNDALQYLVRLSKLATRNWDWVAVDASYTAGSNIINVQTTTAFHLVLM